MKKFLTPEFAFGLFTFYVGVLLLVTLLTNSIFVVIYGFVMLLVLTGVVIMYKAWKGDL